MEPWTDGTFCFPHHNFQLGLCCRCCSPMKALRVYVRDFERRRLEGVHVLVINAGSPTGSALAVALAQSGCSVMLADKSAPCLQSTMSNVLQVGNEDKVYILLADLSTPAGLDALASKVNSTSGRIDVILFASPPAKEVAFDAMDCKAISAIVESSLLVPMLVTRRFLPEMKQHGSGIIAVVSSAPLSSVSWPNLSPFCASQAGLAAWALALRAELKGTGVSVVNISSGFLPGDDGPKAQGVVGFLAHTPWTVLLRLCVGTCACAAPFGTVLSTLAPWPIIGAVQQLFPDIVSCLLHLLIFCGQADGAPAGISICSTPPIKTGIGAGQSK